MQLQWIDRFGTTSSMTRYIPYPLSILLLRPSSHFAFLTSLSISSAVLSAGLPPSVFRPSRAPCARFVPPKCLQLTARRCFRRNCLCLTARAGYMLAAF